MTRLFFFPFFFFTHFFSLFLFFKLTFNVSYFVFSSMVICFFSIRVYLRIFKAFLPVFLLEFCIFLEIRFRNGRHGDDVMKYVA